MTSPDRKRVHNWLIVGGLSATVTFVVVAYPYFVADATARIGVRGVAGGLLALSFASLVLPMRRPGGVFRHGAASSLLLPVLLMGALATGSSLYLHLVPAAVYLTLATVFGASLRGGKSIIEQAARFLVPEAPEFVRGYCRGVTLLWVCFFGAAACGVFGLAILASPESWTRFTGTFLYTAMALVSVVEFFFRKTWFRYYFHGGPFDRFWSTLFPAENTPRGRASMDYIEQYRAQSGESTRSGAS